MNVKRIRSSLSALLAYLVVAGILFADDPVAIITERYTSIQLFSTSNFTEWPGVSGLAPIDVSSEKERIWLIWPGCIINLNRQGESDYRTLLTLFSTRDARWGEEHWTAQKGVVCSDGFWRGFTASPNEFSQLDLFSGIVSTIIPGLEVPESIYPASKGDLLIISKGKAELVRSDNEILKLKRRIPPASMLAVSTWKPLIAWQDGRNGSLHVADYEQQTEELVQLLPGVTWNMSWTENFLVVAYPGKLLVLDFQEGKKPVFYLLEDERLPGHWYRIRGGSNYLIIQSPEVRTAAVLSLDATPGFSRENNGDFPELLKKYTLHAGDTLEKSGFTRQADRYYRWVIPYIREYRSRFPLEEIWPNLESEIIRRRFALQSIPAVSAP